MKRIISVLVFILFASSSFAQQIKITSPTPREILLKKADKEKRTGWTLIGVGGALVLGSMIVAVAHGPSGKDEPEGLEIPFTLGLGSLVAGTVVECFGIRHEKKALEASAYLNFQPIPSLY